MTRNQYICLVLVLLCAGFPGLCTADPVSDKGIEHTAPGYSSGEEIESPVVSMSEPGSLTAPLPSWSLCIGGTSNDWGRAIVAISGGSMVTAGLTDGIEMPGTMAIVTGMLRRCCPLVQPNGYGALEDPRGIVSLRQGGPLMKDSS